MNVGDMVEAALPSRLGIMQTDSLDGVYVARWLHGHAFATVSPAEI